VLNKLITLSKEFKNDEQGMEIVQVVMILLIVVLLIAGLWALLGPWIQNMWSRIFETDINM
jgi:Flp pilus assembly pilin Flp